MAEGVGSIIGNSVGEAAAFAAGIAIGPLLAPLLRALENETWSQYPDMPVNAGALARGVAERKIPAGAAGSEAALTGFGPTAFTTLVELARSSPSVADGLRLIQRGQMSPADFVTVLQRAGLEDEWIAAYQQLAVNGLEPWQVPLSPADLALGLIRGNLESFQAPSGPAFPQGLSSEGSNVPPDPVLGLDVVSEAAASGIDADRMALLARNVGLPPGVIEGLNMLNRGIINEAAFALLIEQSDARLSWGPFLIKLRQMLLTVHETVEARLRGYITTDAEMYQRTAMHGLDETDTNLLFDITGRPLAVHQVTTGLARGGMFGGDYEGVPEPYLTALRQSNIRPEWGNVAYSNRYTYPSGFQIKAEVKAGDLPVPEAIQLLLEVGWSPHWAEFFANAWAGAKATGAKKFTVGEVKAAWKAGLIDPNEARTRLEALGYSLADANLLINTWAFVPPPVTPIA